MAIYTASRPVKTLTLHKPSCRFIPKEGLRSCGCGDRGHHGDQRWYCEEHITLNAVDEYMNGRFWAALFCEECFRD